MSRATTRDGEYLCSHDSRDFCDCSSLPNADDFCRPWGCGSNRSMFHAQARAGRRIGYHGSTRRGIARGFLRSGRGRGAARGCASQQDVEYFMLVFPSLGRLRCSGDLGGYCCRFGGCACRRDQNCVEDGAL